MIRTNGSAQMALAAFLARGGAFAGGDEDRVRLADCVVDFLAAVLVGAATPMGRFVIERYASESVCSNAFALAYLAELTEFSHGLHGSGGHAGSTTLPAAFAFATHGPVSQDALTTAALAGYEAFARVGRAFSQGLTRLGAVADGFIGPIGAAVVAGRALGMDAVGLSACLGAAAGLAPVRAGGGRRSWANALEIAHDAAAGILAAELVAGNVARPSLGLDELFERVAGVPAAYGEPDGTGLAIHHVYFKPYACCRFACGAIEASLGLRAESFPAGRIERVQVAVAPRTADICGFVPRESRTDYVSRQCSLPYLTGLALLRGTVTPGDVLDPDPEWDREILAFARERIETVAREDLAENGDIGSAILHIHLSGGTVVERRALSPLGCPEAPMRSDQILAKFEAAAASLLSAEERETWVMLARRLAWAELSGRVSARLTTLAHLDT